MTRAFSASLVMLNSSAMVSREGAIMVDARGEINVKHATRRVAVHRLRFGQLIGFVGSSSDDHVTLDVLASYRYEETSGHDIPSWDPHPLETRQALV